MEPVRIGEVLAELTNKMYVGPQGDRLAVARIGTREPISDELRHAIAYRDGYHCVWCWSESHLQLDHVIPWSAGGSDIDTNLRMLCKVCNEDRSNYTTDMHTAAPDPITVECVRCTRTESDSTVAPAFCLVCGRLSDTRRDQLKLTGRHHWVIDMSGDDWRRHLRRARASEKWPIRLSIPREKTA